MKNVCSGLSMVKKGQHCGWWWFTMVSWLIAYHYVGCYGCWLTMIKSGQQWNMVVDNLSGEMSMVVHYHCWGEWFMVDHSWWYWLRMKWQWLQRWLQWWMILVNSGWYIWYCGESAPNSLVISSWISEMRGWISSWSILTLKKKEHSRSPAVAWPAQWIAHNDG